MTQFKRALFVATTCAFATALATMLAAVFYLFGMKHFHYTAVRPIFHLSSVRAYLFDERFRRFVEMLNEEEAQQDDAFASVWDTSVGTLLSTQMFHPVEMYGVQKYMYNAGLRKLSFTLDVDGFRRSFSMVDSPSLRRTIDELHAVNIYTASYDGFGFRRVDAELTEGCDVRVLFLGDSFTDGVYMSDRETAVNRYGHIARKRSRRGLPDQYGVDGYGTLEEAFVLAHYFEKLDRPRVAIVMHLPNDVDGNVDSVIDGSMVDASREWTDDLAYLKRIVEFGRQHAIKVVVVAIPLARQSENPSTRKNYQDVLRGFCEREGVRFVDLLAAWPDATSERSTWKEIRTGRRPATTPSPGSSTSRRRISLCRLLTRRRGADFGGGAPNSWPPPRSPHGPLCRLDSLHLQVLEYWYGAENRFRVA